MARKGSHQRPHYRRSKTGKKFRAGRGRYKRNSYYGNFHQYPSPKKISYSSRKKLVKAKTILTKKEFYGALATGLSIVTGNPLPLIAYKIFTAGDFAYKIKKDLDRKGVNNQLKEFTKEGLAYGTDVISDRKISEFSKSIANSFYSTGFTGAIAQAASLDQSFVHNTFEKTIRSALDGGLDSISVRMVEVIW